MAKRLVHNSLRHGASRVRKNDLVRDTRAIIAAEEEFGSFGERLQICLGVVGEIVEVDGGRDARVARPQLDGSSRVGSLHLDDGCGPVVGLLRAVRVAWLEAVADVAGSTEEEEVRVGIPGYAAAGGEVEAVGLGIGAGGVCLPGDKTGV